MSLKVIDGLKIFFVFYALRKNNFALAKKDVKDRIWPQYQIGKTQERIVSKITTMVNHFNNLEYYIIASDI